MSYDSSRRRIIHDVHQARIVEFAKRYRSGFPTIVLLPGGMGSQLDRSPQAYTTTDGSVPGTGFRNVWIDLDIFFGRDLEFMAIQTNERDLEITSWLRSGWNPTIIVFACDWRRLPSP